VARFDEVAAGTTASRPAAARWGGTGIKPEGNVFDDDSEDVLTGSQGDDWFLWNSVEDRATDLGDEVFATAT
jgi:hypothetical protein